MNGALYDLVLSPLERRAIGPIRKRLLGSLAGNIVEVGAGTGRDFAYYGAAADVRALEPDPSMARRAARRIEGSAATIDLRVAGDRWLETLPPESIDIVVFALVLCTVSDPARALARAHRALRANGKIVVLEHVRSARPGRRLWLAIAPMWRALAGGCHLDRSTEATIASAGFDIDRLKTTHLPWLALGQDLIEGEAFKRPSAPLARPTS